MIKYKPGAEPARPLGARHPGRLRLAGSNRSLRGDHRARTTSSDPIPGQHPAPWRAPRLSTGWKNTILAGGDVEATFPVFDDAGNTGQNGWFHILGYATFKI